MSATCLHRRRLTQVVLALLLWIGLVPGMAAAQPYRFIVTDLEGLEQVQREFGTFRDLLADLRCHTARQQP